MPYISTGTDTLSSTPSLVTVPSVTLPDTVFTKILFLVDEILAKSLYTTLNSIVSLTLYSSVNSETVFSIVHVIVLSLYTPPFNVDLFSSISYGSVLYESVINASDNYLSSDELSNGGYEGFFLNPVKPHNPQSITISEEEDNNHIDIYYISKEVTEEVIDKTTSTKLVDSESDVVNYSVNYSASEGSLRIARCVDAGLIFYSEIDGVEDEELVREVLSMIKWIGSMRNRGLLYIIGVVSGIIIGLF